MERTSGATVTIELLGTNAPGDGTVVVTTSAPLEQLTGFLGFVLDDKGPLTSEATMRLERELEWDGSAVTHNCEALSVSAP